MVNVVAVAIERGYLNVPDGMLIDARNEMQLPPEKCRYSLYWQSRRTYGSIISAV